MKWNRHLQALAVAGLVLAAAPVVAAEFPERPVRFVVGFGAGGGTDALARIVGQKLTEKWRFPVVIENRPGADGSIAAEAVAQSAPDGHAIAWVSNAHAVTPVLRKLPYDAVKSFVPLTLVAYVPDVLVVPATLPVSSLAEFIAYVKARPGELNYGSPGEATAPVPETALLMKLAGLKLTHVPYKSGAEVMLGMLRGDVQMYFGALPTIATHVKAGKVKALAVAAPSRSPAMPDVPTVMEAAGFAGFEGIDWTGALLPAGTPKAIVDRLSKDMIDAIRSPDVREQFASKGFVPIANTPEEFRRMIETDIARWGPLLRELGLVK